jgi:hypothetical protein
MNRRFLTSPFAARLLLGLALGFVLPSATIARGAVPAAGQLRFRYIPFEHGEILPCRHELLDEASRDWAVKCSDEQGRGLKQFTVHLWVTRLERTREPRLSYEVLYWITDRTRPNAPRGSSSTIWFHFRDPSELHSLELGQGVSDETAGLYLTYLP